MGLVAQGAVLRGNVLQVVRVEMTSMSFSVALSNVDHRHQGQIDRIHRHLVL